MTLRPISAKLDPRLIDALDETAKQTGTSRNALINEAVSNFLGLLDRDAVFLQADEAELIQRCRRLIRLGAAREVSAVHQMLLLAERHEHLRPALLHALALVAAGSNPKTKDAR